MDLDGERLMVIGGTGSLGQALIRRTSTKNKVIIFSRDEAKHWTLRNHLGKETTVEFEVGDIRDRDRLESILLKWHPTIVVIAAALKQVDTCERVPFESVQTNTLGINNVVETVTRQVDRLPELKTVLMVSTDKACAPTNVYGMCKAISERVVTSQCLMMRRPKFVVVRYGNVLESRGSIIPLFRWQAEHLDCLTVTHPEMTRFFMTLDESIDLIFAASQRADSGEVWLPRLRSMRIMDLARIFADRFDKPIEIVGVRPGEKLHELLISEPESVRSRLDGQYFRMAPSHVLGSVDAKIFSYGSNDDVLMIDELSEYLDKLGICDVDVSRFVGKEIDEIVKLTPAKGAVT